MLTYTLFLPFFGNPCYSAAVVHHIVYTKIQVVVVGVDTDFEVMAPRLAVIVDVAEAVVIADDTMKRVFDAAAVLDYDILLWLLLLKCLMTECVAHR